MKNRRFWIALLAALLAAAMLLPLLASLIPTATARLRMRFGSRSTSWKPSPTSFPPKWRPWRPRFPIICRKCSR